MSYEPLERIHDEYAALLDPLELIQIAGSTLPCRIDPKFQHATALQKLLNKIPNHQEFHIKVATKEGLQEAFRRFPVDAMDEPESLVLKGEHGGELGRGWFCRSQSTALRAETRGFRLRLRNFAVGRVNIYNDEDGSALGVSSANRLLRTVNRLAWFCGEIHVTNDKIVPNTPRDGLEINIPARRLIEEIRQFYRQRIEDAGAHSDFNGFKRAMEESTQLIEKVNGKPPAAGSSDAAELERLLAKLEEASNKTKGMGAEGTAKAMLRDLLNAPEIKKQRKQLVQKLKGLVPKGGPDKAAQKQPTAGGASKPEPPAASPTTAVTGIDLEALLTEVVLILEKHLGKDHDDIAPISEDIKKAFQARLGE